MNKSGITKLFNKTFEDFLSKLVELFPNNTDVIASQTGLLALKRANPKLLISVWIENVFQKYATQIAEGNLDYFLEKDYRTDLKDILQTETYLDAIDRIRAPLRELTGDKLNDVIKYLQNLNTICFTYLSLN